MSSKLILSSDDADSVNVTVELFLDLIQTVLNRSPTPTDLWACLQTLTLPILGTRHCARCGTVRNQHWM